MQRAIMVGTLIVSFPVFYDRVVDLPWKYVRFLACVGSGDATPERNWLVLDSHLPISRTNSAENLEK